MKQQYVNELSQRRFCRMDKNYMSTVQRSGAWYCESYCFKTLSGDWQCFHQIVTITWNGRC